MKSFKSEGFFLQKPEPEDEEYPEPKIHKNKYVPIDEAYSPEDDSWKRYGEGLDTYVDDYAGELEDDRVGLQNTENKKSAFYFGGHYLDMDDPYDRAFYNAKKAELEEAELKTEQNIEPYNSSIDKFSHLEGALPSREPINAENYIYLRKKITRRPENLKTRKNLPLEKLERINRAKLAKVKQDLVLGDTNDKAKYIDKESLHQDEISEILSAHQEQFADTSDNFEEIDNSYERW